MSRKSHHSKIASSQGSTRSQNEPEKTPKEPAKPAKKRRIRGYLINISKEELVEMIYDRDDRIEELEKELNELKEKNYPAKIEAFRKKIHDLKHSVSKYKKQSEELKKNQG